MNLISFIIQYIKLFASTHFGVFLLSLFAFLFLVGFLVSSVRRF